jgi:hypothetical protein
VVSSFALRQAVEITMKSSWRTGCPAKAHQGIKTMMKHLIASALFLLAGSHFAMAELAAPQGRAILEISGQIGVGNAEDANGNPVAIFDFDGLTQLPQISVEMTTEWTEGLQVFEGVLLRDVLRLVDASGESIRAIALNDYEATIPMSDADTYDVLLALRQNGKLMRVRDKGPIWIIYPASQPDAHVANPHNLKMVWQLAKLRVQ